MYSLFSILVCLFPPTGYLGIGSLVSGNFTLMLVQWIVIILIGLIGATASAHVQETFAELKEGKLHSQNSMAELRKHIAIAATLIFLVYTSTTLYCVQLGVNPSFVALNKRIKAKA